MIDSSGTTATLLPATLRAADAAPVGLSGPLTATPESAPAQGLVICAITGREASGCGCPQHPTDVDEAIRRLLIVDMRFPASDLITAAAGQFVAPLNPVRFSRAGRSDTELREGTTTYLDIAPGLVRLRRTDPNRAHRTAERAAAAATRDQLTRAAVLHKVGVERSALLLRMQRVDPAHGVLTFEDDKPYRAALLEYVAVEASSHRGVIAAWSAKSRARMVSTICELDLSPLVSGDVLPCMLTLTLPGDWLAVAPDADTFMGKYKNFLRSWLRFFGTGVRCIWKREFQRRGAPHLHLWLVPPLDFRGRQLDYSRGEQGPQVIPFTLNDFRVWVSRAWTAALDPSKVEDRPAGHDVTPGTRCVCSEWCRSLAAGTGVDFAEALRARDPKRLAVYFLKESLGGEDKAYQNAAPVQWCVGYLPAGHEGPRPAELVQRGSVGRFWGYRGIDKAVSTVELESSVGVQVARMMRRHQRAQGLTVRDENTGELIRVPVTRSRMLSRMNAKTGELRVNQWKDGRARPLRRRAASMGAAGWVAVNDGANFGASLSRMVERLTADLAYSRDMFAADAAPADSMPLDGFVPRQHGPALYAGPPVGFVPSAPVAAPAALDQRAVMYGLEYGAWLLLDPNRT